MPTVAPVGVTVTKGEVRLEVEDNGGGFPPDKPVELLVSHLGDIHVFVRCLDRIRGTAGA